MDLSDIRRENNVELRLALLWTWIKTRARSYPIFDDAGEIIGYSYLWLDDVTLSQDQIDEVTRLALACAVANLLGLTNVPAELDDRTSVPMIDDVF